MSTSKVRSEPSGDIISIRVASLATKPQRNGVRYGRWLPVWNHFKGLEVGRKFAVVVALENKSDANRLNSSLHGYAAVRDCKRNGWKVRSETHEQPNGTVEAWLWKEPV